MLNTKSIENILKINDKLKNRVATIINAIYEFRRFRNCKKKNWTTDQYIDFINEIKKEAKPQVQR